MTDYTYRFLVTDLVFRELNCGLSADRLPKRKGARVDE